MGKSTYKQEAACCSLITLQNVTLLGQPGVTYDLIGARTKTGKEEEKKAQSQQEYKITKRKEACEIAIAERKR